MRSPKAKLRRWLEVLPVWIRSPRRTELDWKSRELKSPWIYPLKYLNKSHSGGARDGEAET